ncbi:MAG TPA: porin, partial [Helicobacteraceae bacterium]|nr:porin [Helicobacteraceae bacterium]
MIACILSSLLEITPTAVGIETKRETEIEERIRTKQSGRYEVLTHLPTTADSLDTMFAYAKAIGVIRTAYIHKDIINGAATNALAFGGQFGFETAQYEGFSTRVLAYTSQNLNSGYYTGIENGDFFGIDKEGFTYIAEANLAYANRLLQIVAGRGRVETPFADSDDNRMAPNSFEGAWSNINMSESLSFQALYFSRWAGA